MDEKFAKEGEPTRPFLATFQLVTPDPDNPEGTLTQQTVNRFDELGTTTITYELYVEVMAALGYEQVEFQYVR